MIWAVLQAILDQLTAQQSLPIAILNDSIASLGNLVKDRILILMIHTLLIGLYVIHFSREHPLSWLKLFKLARPLILQKQLGQKGFVKQPKQPTTLRSVPSGKTGMPIVPKQRGSPSATDGLPADGHPGGRGLVLGLHLQQVPTEGGQPAAEALLPLQRLRAVLRGAAGAQVPPV